MNDTPWRETRFPAPAPIEWKEVSDPDMGVWDECYINGINVASLEKRAYYCDRGHFSVKCWLNGIDDQDSFPRYYMDKDTAVIETEKFLKWRLWKIRS